MKHLKFLSIVFALSLIVSCSDDDDNNPPVINEEEVITTLEITLEPISFGNTVVMTYRDLDGDGPGTPDVTVSGDLVSTISYTGSIKVLNETEDPAEDITEEIMEEDEEHQFFFAINGASGSTVTYSDSDDNGNPIGLNFILNAGVIADNNTMVVTLLHEPNKDAAGVSDGDITNAGGETDIDVTFTYNVQ